jgi:protein TonB
MKKFLVLILCLILSNDFLAQESSQAEDNNVYSSAGIDVMPEFPGGIPEFGKYISTNFVYPKVKGLQGKVLVEFVVEKDGSLVDIKVLRDVGYGTGAEAIRLLKVSPLWKPGMQNGRIVRVRFLLPINISVK